VAGFLTEALPGAQVFGCEKGLGCGGYGGLKTLHLYLTRQVIASLLMTVAVFTFVLMLGNALREILPLVVSGEVKVVTVAKALGLLIPYVWVFALPMGMLTATLLVFGRFSADQELTAVRASGVSLVSLVTPLLGLSLVLCGFSAFVNMYLGPQCRTAYKDMVHTLRLGISSSALPEGRFIKDFSGYIFHVKKNLDGDLREVTVFVLRNETNVETTVSAPRGRLVLDGASQKLSLTLYDGKLMTVAAGRPIPLSFEEWSLEFGYVQPKGRKEKIDDMTFAELQAELRERESLLAMPVRLGDMTPKELADWKEFMKRQKKDVVAPIVFHIHRQAAFSLASFGFTLVGIPLGIRVHRRETNIGIAIALLLVSVYYSFILLSQSLEGRPEWVPHLIVWIPNFVFQAAGAVLLWRANRGI